MGEGRLGPQERADALAALAGRELDVLIVGGGVVGAGTALDAVTRGLDVGLVEARDWASGTSSRSSKLIHGGLRYLEMLDFGLVREALGERALLLRDLPVPELDDALPRVPRDPARVVELSDRWGLDSPLDRLLAAFEVAHSA